MTEIREIDVATASDAVLGALYDVERRSSLAGREQMPFWDLEEYLGAVRAPDSAAVRRFLAARDDDGRLVGVGILEGWLSDNLDKAALQAHVDPDARGRGVGTALVGELERLAIADGRQVLLCEVAVPPGQEASHADVRFAQRRGYRPDNVEVERHLDLPVDDVSLQRWVDEAAPAHAGYTLETHVGPLPEELRESFCRLMGQLVVDAPTGSVEFEENDYPVARLEERLQSVAAMGRELFETVAITPERLVVAHSTLAVPLQPGKDVYQWGTFVDRKHRGHRLGLATKAVNLRAAQQARPGCRRVITQNAESNEQMVAINATLGFVPVELRVELVKRV